MSLRLSTVVLYNNYLQQRRHCKRIIVSVYLPIYYHYELSLYA